MSARGVILPSGNGNGRAHGEVPLAPPQNLEAEQNVLGAVLLSDSALPALRDEEGLEPGDFYRDDLGRIYRAMLELHALGVGVDALTLTEHLKQAGDSELIGGAAAVEFLAGPVPAVGNVRQYARIVRDNATLRRLLRVTYEIQAQVHGHEALPHELVERAELAIAGLKSSGGGNSDVARIRRALLEDPQDTRDASGPAREEVPGAGGLLYRGIAATLFGERGSGKSIVACVAGLGAAAAGERVLYLDRENGPGVTRERTDAILDARDEWGDPLADGRFVGRHYPELRPDWSSTAFGEAIAGAGFTVVIFDSMREMLTQLGIDANNGDTSPFITFAVTPLVQRGVAVVLLDNVGHENTHRQKGDGGKADAVPQIYKVTTSEQFSQVRTGRITLTCSRSRFGDVDREWTMRVGGGVYETPAPRTEAPDAKAARELREKRERFRAACVAALSEQSPLGREPLIAAARKMGSRGKGDRLRGWLSELAADPASGIARDAHDGYQLASSGLTPANGVNPGSTPAGDALTPLTLPYGGSGQGLPDPADGGQAELEARAERLMAEYGGEPNGGPHD